RREFMKRAKMEVARLLRHQGDLTVLLLDVDYFKQVNDTYGHPAGDRVLKFVSQSIVSALREEDILGRIGGEEFAALLPATDQISAGATAERIRTAIENLRIQVGEDEIKVTISIGISQLVPGENAIEPVMVRADRALYRAKDQGRNQVCVLSGIESMAG
ncbi:GGDEF domain-containing protein, partial [Sedimenticola sp.]|uniref:GGDEF domain-containing protein n=1 Tax=Sedimenticola sp. TaxID=1940285 RepID=UPI003D102DC3